MSLSETLARLTMNLNRRPDLTRRLRVVDDDNRKSVAESSAEIIQKIFTTCLTDRTGTRTSKPEGKRVGVYMFANLVLKLLFAVRLLASPTVLFSAPLEAGPCHCYAPAYTTTMLLMTTFTLSHHSAEELHLRR